MTMVYFWMRTFSRGAMLQGEESGLAKTITTAATSTMEPGGATILAGHTVRAIAKLGAATFTIESGRTKEMATSAKLPRPLSFDFFCESDDAPAVAFASIEAAKAFAQAAAPGSPFSEWRAGASSVSLVSLLST